MDEFRGWGGSGYRDVTITPQDFSSEAQYLADRQAHVPGRTTRSFRPGPIPGGEWAVELGLAAIPDESLGDTDGKVGYRVEIELRENPGFADDPYEPKRYDESSVRRGRGWYAGDFHVHAEHSGDSGVTMAETFDYAFRSIGRGGAGLDFVIPHRPQHRHGVVGDLALALSRRAPEGPGHARRRRSRPIAATPTSTPAASRWTTARGRSSSASPAARSISCADHVRRSGSSTRWRTPGASPRSTIRRSSRPRSRSSRSSAAVAPGTTRTPRPTTRRSMPWRSPPARRACRGRPRSGRTRSPRPASTSGRTSSPKGTSSPRSARAIRTTPASPTARPRRRSAPRPRPSAPTRCRSAAFAARSRQGTPTSR